MIKSKLVNKKYQLLFTLLLVAVMSFLLFIPPQIGIANSGDFGRIMDIFDLYYTSNYSNFSHFFDIFTFGRPLNAPHYNGYVATSSLFVLVSLLINKIFTLFNGDDYFYIYSLSLVYAIFYAVGFYLLINYLCKQLKHKYLAFVLSIITLIILSDSLFIEYFNSFFQEPGFIVCCLLFVACFLQFRIFWLDLLFITLIIFSKLQYMLYFLLLIPLYIKYKGNFSLAKVILIIIAMSIPTYVFTQIDTYGKGMNQFASVFMGLLHNETKEQGTKVLFDINMNPEYSVFTGMGYWTVVGQLNSTHDQNTYNLWQQAIDDSSQLKAIHGYLLQPAKIFTNTYDYLNIVEKEGPFAANLGNYKTDQGDKFRISAFKLYSSCAKHLRYLFIFNILLTIILIVTARKKAWQTDSTLRYSLLITLNIIAIIAIPVYIIGTGYEEPVKHILDVYFDEGIIFIMLLLEYSVRLQNKNGHL
ncbi:MAG: hypothetical protein K0R14_1804 [Burkholderiales bacterium]|jgi:hypothetical protein|nr:hypothetical protein [Burkholderiales bacterium]